MRPASSVDCDGQKAPLPIPVTALARKPCQGLSTNAYSDEAEREEAERDRQHPLAADAVDERARDRSRDEADAGVRREDQPGDAEPDPALVVQVDEQERDDEAVPERVHQPADLQELHLSAAGAGSSWRGSSAP